MAETTLLRQSAIVRNASVGTSPPSAPRGPVKTGELPLVQVKMGPGGPQVLTPQQKPVEILAPRDADSAVRTGGLPMVCVKMTSRGPQIDDGQDSSVVILPPKDQKHAIAAGGLPMVQVKRQTTGFQIQNLPSAQSVRSPVQAPAPALSQPRGARVVRVAAPKQVPLPPVPEFTADQLMLCRHLVGKYLAALRPVELPAQESAEGSVQTSAEVSAQSTTESIGVPDLEATPREVSGPVNEAAATSREVSGPVNEDAIAVLAEATIDMIDQALVAVAVRAEAVAAANAPIPLVDQEPLAEEVSPMLPVAPAASIIPAAPTASYVAGRVGGRTNGYAGGRVQRNASMAPRRVPRAGALPPVIVKMEGGRSVVQNQAEVAAVRAAVAAAAQAEVAPTSETTDGSAQG